MKKLILIAICSFFLFACTENTIPEGEWISTIEPNGSNGTFKFDGSEAFGEDDKGKFFNKVDGRTIYKMYYKTVDGLLYISVDPSFRGVESRHKGDIYRKK